MTEDEYIDVCDRQKLVTVTDILRDIDCNNDATRMRIRSIRDSIKLIVADIDERFSVE